MPPSSDHNDEPSGFRSDAEMLAVVTRRAELQAAAHRRTQRLVSGGIAALVVVLVGVSVVALTRGDDGGEGARVEQVDVGDSTSTPGLPPAAATSTTLTRQPLPDDASSEGWTPIVESPLSPRSNPVSAWTGTELLVWGGEAETSDACTISEDGSFLCGEQAHDDGAAYDPATDTWRAMAASPLPPEQGSSFRYEGVWTGTELVVLGGSGGEGAAYDPDADTWRRLALAPIAPREGFGMVWTGREVVVVGGSARSDEPDPEDRFGSEQTPVEVVSFSPGSGTWRRLPDLPEGRVAPVVLMADGRVVLLGGYLAQEAQSVSDSRFPPGLVLDDGGWTDLGEPLVGEVTAAVWTGERLVVSGTYWRDRSAAVHPVAAALTMATGVWEPLPDPARRATGGHLVWTGTEVVLLPATGLGMPVERLAVQAIDPVRGGAWRVLPAVALDAVQDAGVAWTGTELLFWGGAWQSGYGGDPRDVGARYSPGPGR